MDRASGTPFMCSLPTIGDGGDMQRRSRPGFIWYRPVLSSSTDRYWPVLRLCSRPRLAPIPTARCSSVLWCLPWPQSRGCLCPMPAGPREWMPWNCWEVLVVETLRGGASSAEGMSKSSNVWANRREHGAKLSVRQVSHVLGSLAGSCREFINVCGIKAFCVPLPCRPHRPNN